MATRRPSARRVFRTSQNTTGTIHKFDALAGTDQMKKRNNTVSTIQTRLVNLCAMTVYAEKSMEELRFEDYIRSVKYPSATTSLFGTTTTSAPNSAFGFNTAPVSSPFNVFSLTSPITTTSSNVPVSSNLAFSTPAPMFTFGSESAASTFRFAEAIKSLGLFKTDTDSKIPSRCIDCEKPPAVQCLHCSKYVCMDCASKHIALNTEKVDAAQKVLKEKLSVLDRLSAAAKERVNAERERIVEQANVERDQACAQIDQLIEQQKKQIQDQSTELGQLAIDKVSSYIQTMNREIEVINDENDQLLDVVYTPPKIQVRYKH